MKIGAGFDADLERIALARKAIGPNVALFVDANGAYRPRQALAIAHACADLDVSWFEEPVTSDDVNGLRWVRDRAPDAMDVAAGEYGYDVFAFRRFLDAGAVDVLQVDATRSCGISGFFHAAAQCSATPLPLSAHTAPTLHAHLCCCVEPAIHVEHFHDHARIESMLFDGALTPCNGALHPDRSRPGLGVELKRANATEYLVWSD